MSQGKFYDFGWHNEWHSSSSKTKPLDCIYLSDKRECQNRECYCFLSKCFDSSHCPHKIREKDRDQVDGESNSTRKCSEHKSVISISEENIEKESKTYSVNTNSDIEIQKENVDTVTPIKISVGDCVTHNVFGSGLVVDVDEKRFKVVFPDEIVRKFINPDVFLSGHMLLP